MYLKSRIFLVHRNQTLQAAADFLESPAAVHETDFMKNHILRLHEQSTGRATADISDLAAAERETGGEKTWKGQLLYLYQRSVDLATADVAFPQCVPGIPGRSSGCGETRYASLLLSL